jgi:putative DNA primase/helicase
VLPSQRVADLLALWILHTHTHEMAWATPYLRITSATAESGKTLLMEILAELTRRGWHAINPSVAVLYRKIDRDAPTLLLDEMDNYPLDDRRDALAVLNAGYKRGAKVDR